MLAHRAAADDDIVQVDEDEVEARQDPVHSPLECVAGVAEAKSHAEEFKQSKRCCNRRFLNIFRIHQNLMVAFAKIHFAGDDTSCNAL